MNVVILRKEGCSRQTCNGIAAQMIALGQPNVRVVQCNRPAAATDLLIRWGCTGRFPHNLELNTPEMIHLASDKIAARRKMLEMGVPTPRTFFTKQEALNFGQYPIIGRKRQHQEGREMTIAHNVNELMMDRRSEYWSEFIRKEREFRVYVFANRILAVSEKIPEFPNKVAWNKSLGNGVFVNLKLGDLPRDVGFLAIQAANALGLDFSAVDIIKKANQSYVLEFNNSPECSPYRQLLYARAFNWFVRRIEENGGQKPEHFQVPRRQQDKMVLLCKN